MKSEKEKALPNLGKRQKVSKAICPTWASAKKSHKPFAQLGQASKKTIWHLPNLGKRQKVTQTICPTWASVEKNNLGFAQVGQAPEKTIWHLPKLGKR